MAIPWSLSQRWKNRGRGARVVRPPLRLEVLEDRLLLDSRVVVSLDASWKFHRGDVPGAQAVSFDDSSWDDVNVPHTWNNIDGEVGGPYYRGIGWYRQHDPIPADWAGKELFLKFDGASLVTDLYVNGTFIGEHKGGFAAFSWDVTPYLNVGDDNVLAVKVNNASDPNVAPLSGDFTVFGGLYRHVNLIATDPLHVSLTDYASPGVYLRQTNVSDASADLQITTKLQNDDAGSRDALVVAQVLDADGNVVTTLTTPQTLDSGQGADVVQSTTIISPHLWNGRSDPYMYQVCVQVIDADSGATVDQVTQPLGFRYFWVDPNTGFYLNGQPYDLHGVDFHQDRIDKGWAISDANQTEDVGLIDEIGATFVRLSHYQHPPLTYDLLDQYGIVAWSEVPLINGATNSQAFFDNVKQQLVEMIRQNYNHPAVLFWGMYNEIGDNTTTRNLVSQMVQLAETEDPDRLTTGASNQADGSALNYLPNVIGFNKYYGWYYGQATDFGTWADNIHRAFPNQAIGISEYGAGASIYQHQDNPPEPPNAGPWHPEEYQDLYHESLWTQISARPFLWVKTIWNMFDFASAGRNEGDTPGRNDKGLVSYDRQTRKDTFYWYKANWSSDPVLYITSRGYINRPTNVVNVKVYSNLDQVELFVNGVSVGIRTSSNHIFTWANVNLASGENDLEVQATQDGTLYTDDVTWYTPLLPDGAAFALINFQPTGLTPPPGYLQDTGLVFADRGNGLYYGWDVDNSANAHVRHVNSDPRYDRLIYMENGTGGQVWAIALPNGTYDIHLVSGDPSFLDSVYELDVNGILTVSGGVNSSQHFQEAWRQVTVTDGYLFVTNAPGSRNNKLNFIDIYTVSGDSPGQTSGLRSIGSALLSPAVRNGTTAGPQGDQVSRMSIPRQETAILAGNLSGNSLTTSPLTNTRKYPVESLRRPVLIVDWLLDDWDSWLKK